MVYPQQSRLIRPGVYPEIQPGFLNVLLSTPGLRFLWPLNEISGTVAKDYSGNGRTGTYDGVTLNKVGPNASVPIITKFDLVNDKITTTASNNSVRGVAVVTFQAVISVTNQADTQMIWGESVSDSASVRFSISLNGAESLVCGVRSGLAAQALSTKTSNAALSVGSHIIHVRVDIANDTVEFLVDGALVASSGAIDFGVDTIFTDAAASVNARAGIGLAGTFPFGGGMAYIAMWSRLLSDANCLAIARAGGFA